MSEENNSPNTDDVEAEVRLSVLGMSCAGCVGAVETALILLITQPL